MYTYVTFTFSNYNIVTMSEVAYTVGIVIIDLKQN